MKKIKKFKDDLTKKDSKRKEKSLSKKKRLNPHRDDKKKDQFYKYFEEE